MRKLIALLAAISVVIPAVPAQQAGQQARQAPVNPRRDPAKPATQAADVALPDKGTIRTTVDLVLVDVRVTDKSGNPIKGLKPEQFTITEENQVQKISSFEYNDIEGVERAHVTNPGPIVVPMGTLPPPKPEYVHAAVRDHRLIVLYFDLTSLHNEDLLRSQQAAQKYINEQISPADLVAIATFGNQVKVPVHFTNDRPVLLRAINSLLPGKDAQLADMAEAAALPGEDTTSQDTGAAFTADDTEFNIFNTDRKLAALESLSSLLRDIPGRKSVVQFTSGITQTGEENRSQLEATTDAANRANVSFYAVDARGLLPEPAGGEARDGSSAGSAMFISSAKATVAHKASRAMFSGSEIMAESAARHDSRETLSTLASDTGGRSFFDLGDFSDVFHQVQADSTGYYLVGYYSTDGRKNGAWRRLKVSVDVPGARVRFREGYYAPRNSILATAQDREKQFMDALRDDAPHVDLPIALETSYFRLDDKDVFVPITAKLPSSVLNWAQQRNRHQAVFDFAAEVHDAASNKVVAALRDQITVTLASDRYAQLQKQSLVYQGGVVLGPGSYKLKFLARENESGRIGSFEEDLDLPKPQPAALELSPMMLSGQLQTIEATKEVLKKTLGQEVKLKSSPLEFSGQRIVPSVTHVFNTQQQLYVFFQAYVPVNTDGAKLRAGLVFFSNGQKVNETPLVEPAEVDAKSRTASFRINLPFGKFVPGGYTVQAVVVEDGGDMAAFARNNFALMPPTP
ncbi:MAG: VWA domain-containing protein [Acidobacteriia bacterium]|nr:VWA domain-containing protein [Terriglobia bacterium]